MSARRLATATLAATAAVTVLSATPAAAEGPGTFIQCVGQYVIWQENSVESYGPTTRPVSAGDPVWLVYAQIPNTIYLLGCTNEL